MQTSMGMISLCPSGSCKTLVASVLYYVCGIVEEVAYSNYWLEFSQCNLIDQFKTHNADSATLSHVLENHTHLAASERGFSSLD